MAGIECRLYRLRRKSVTIEIREGKVIVKAPLTAPLVGIDLFIVQKRKWITDKIEAYFLKYRQFSEILSYRTFLLGGTQYGMEVSDRIKKIQFSDDRFLAPLALLDGTQDKFCAAVRKWYRRHATEYLFERLNFLANAFGLSFSGVGLTDARSKWGSCTAKGFIRLNWRLVLLSRYVCDYVLIHELCHTKYHNHSADFWNMVGKMFPGFKSARKSLKECSILIGTYR